jgi:hypothetical protein
MPLWSHYAPGLFRDDLKRMELSVRDINMIGVITVTEIKSNFTEI